MGKNAGTEEVGMVDWHAIDTVLLDMDGTLLDLHFDNYFWLQHLPKRYSELKDMPFDTAKDMLYGKIMDTKGSLAWYCLDYWTAELDVDIIGLKDEIADLIAPRPFVIEFLQALKAANKEVILVTNAHRAGLDLKMKRVDLSPWFDAMVASHDYREPKESAKFWQQLHQQFGFEPSKTLFIDDTENILASAEHFGIKHLLTLSQPDSKNPCRKGLRYPQFHHFDEIMPSPKGQ